MPDPIVPIDAADIAHRDSPAYRDNEQLMTELQFGITADEALLAQTRDVEDRKPIQERLGRAQQNLAARRQHRENMLQVVRRDLATPPPAPAAPQPPPPLPTVVETRARARAEYAAAIKTNPMRAAQLLEQYGPAVARSEP